jgi:CubicO group peptidase (beta-lactamase class C family)/membrane protein DedA with SNARE-associated domain
VACLGGLFVGWIYYLAIIPLIPSLIGTHPVLLEALSGSLPAQIAAGSFARLGRASLVLALAAPILGMMAFDPLWWWAGRRYGDAVTQQLAARNPRSARGVMRGRRLFDRFGGWTLVVAYYLPVPNTILYALAGWAGFGLLRFVVLDLIGTILYTSMGVALGYALGSRAAHVAGLISHYSIVATVALVTGLILLAWWRNRKDRAAPTVAAVGQNADDGVTAQAETQRRNKRGRSATRPVTVEGGQDSDGGAAVQVAEPVEARLRPLVADGTVPGLVYAVVTPGGAATGQLSGAGGQALGPHVLLEIGSVTKVFTALLLADLAVRGEVELDDPIARHLPTAVARACTVAERITLRQLATHTSGLPRLPGNMLPMALLHPGDPYARYSAERLYRALRGASRPVPAEYRYSNYGFGLLGHLLSRAAGRPYAELLADRVTGPLGLTETGADVPPGHVAATGHRRGRPVPPWHLGVLEGAGALSSTATDLARFLGANLAPEATPLCAAIETIQCPAGNGQTGLGWHIASPGNRQVLWHNGATGGFSAMLALDRGAGCAVAAVATASPTRDQPLDGAVFAALAALTSAEIPAEAAP